MVKEWCPAIVLPRSSKASSMSAAKPGSMIARLQGSRIFHVQWRVTLFYTRDKDSIAIRVDGMLPG